jgi:hypothetical protein
VKWGDADIVKLIELGAIDDCRTPDQEAAVIREQRENPPLLRADSLLFS